MSQRVLIPGPCGPLEGLHSTGMQAAAVLCHPHPCHGGSMNTKLMYWMDKAMQGLGMAVLRFNMRGVGSSAGQWDNGHGETEDGLAALDWMATQHPDSRLLLAGFSFGAYTAMRALGQAAQNTDLLLIAPAVHLYDCSNLLNRQSTQRIHLIQGLADTIAPPDQVLAWCQQRPWIQPHTVPGADHFFSQHQPHFLQALRQSLNPLYAGAIPT